MQGYRLAWGQYRTVRCDLSWGLINRDSYVVVTASEGREGMEDGHVILSTASPDRFLGDARFTVDNIAPYDGGVRFRVSIDWPDPLMLWTDIIVFDEIR